MIRLRTRYSRAKAEPRSHEWNEGRGGQRKKAGRKTTFSPRNHNPPPPPPPASSPPWPRFSYRTAYFLPYETQAKNTPEKNRLRRLTHTTYLIRVRVVFLGVWLLLRRTFFLLKQRKTFFACFSSFFISLAYFKLFSTLFMWINLLPLFLRLTTPHRRLQSPFRSRLRSESVPKYGYPDLRSFPVNQFFVVLYLPEQLLCFVPSWHHYFYTASSWQPLSVCSSPTYKERFRKEQGTLAHRTTTKETITVSWFHHVCWLSSWCCDKGKLQ